MSFLWLSKATVRELLNSKLAADPRHRATHKLPYAKRLQSTADHVAVFFAKALSFPWILFIGAFCLVTIFVCCLYVIPLQSGRWPSALFRSVRLLDARGPQLIPRIIHQTYPGLEPLPVRIAELRASWKLLNPTWSLQLWDETRCLAFVRREFPDKVVPYSQLPSDMERSHFCGYLVVLRQGGAFADIDTECKQPLDEVIQPYDTLVVGWKLDSQDSQSAPEGEPQRRQRQVQRSFFAAVPTHSAVRAVCQHISEHFCHRFSADDSTDTQERTGCGAWTDAVLSTTYPPLSKGAKIWSTRFLPQVATGAAPYSPYALTPDKPGVVAVHHPMGIWKDSTSSDRLTAKVRRWLEPSRSRQDLKRLPNDAISNAALEEARRWGATGYPVAINHAGTVFTMLVDGPGAGDAQSREDVSAVVTRVGNWQAGMENTLWPRAAMALVARLGQVQNSKAVFLDIGAGMGFYSLTAAARGHPVVATELSPRSLELFQASLELNGLTAAVSVLNVTLGSDTGVACVEPHATSLGASVRTWQREEIARGFAAPYIHRHTAANLCTRTAERLVMQQTVPEEMDVGVVRVSAGAWTEEVLRGGLPFLCRRRPAAVLVEVDMSQMARIGSTDLYEVLMELWRMGYTDMGHAGQVCVDRFKAIVASERERDSEHSVQIDLSSLQQPAWCELEKDGIQDVLEQNRKNGQLARDAINAPGVELVFMQLSADMAGSACPITRHQNNDKYGTVSVSVDV